MRRNLHNLGRRREIRVWEEEVEEDTYEDDVRKEN